MHDFPHYDRSQRPLEFWTAILASVGHPSSFTEDELESALSLAVQYADEGASAATKSLYLYILGKVILLLREHYPSWDEWVAHAAVLGGEWAHISGQRRLVARSDSLFLEYITALREDARRQKHR